MTEILSTGHLPQDILDGLKDVSMDSRHSGLNDLMKGRRCRYSEEGKRMCRSENPDRVGTIIRFNLRGNPVVLWDGLKTKYSIHPSFIELFDPGDQTCTIDLSRAPVLRELLGLSETPSGDGEAER